MRPLAFLIFSLLILTSSLAQESSVNNLFKVDYETPLTIELKEREQEAEGPEDAIIDPFRKKKKKNRKVFFGIKTKRGFTKKGFRDKVVTELFHYLKEKDYVGPDDYDRDFYWYDFRKKKIINSLKPDPKKSGVLHGHYVKKIGEQVLEEGYFYKGKKHGRWIELNTSDILTDKQIYWKGWPEESRMRFYDFQREQLMEVIPVHFGEREGTYYAFHENGQVAAVGEYKFDQKIGVWREFYDNRRIKREIKYPDDPFDKSPSYILREFSKDGRELYSREKFFSGVD